MQKHALYQIASLAAAYCNADCRCYHEETILASILLAQCGKLFGADARGDDGYEQHVIRNLHMMLTCWEPDDSIFTANSTRFDKDRLVYPGGYYFFYLYIGAKYNIPQFLAMANYAFRVVFEKDLLSPDLLGRFMLLPELIDLEWDACHTPTGYKAFYADSGIARVRRGNFSLHRHEGQVQLPLCSQWGREAGGEDRRQLL